MSVLGHQPRRTAGRALLIVLAVSAAVIGVWASAAPASFYRSFPGGGRHWVELLPPYNEHLTVDVGAFYLAFTLLFAWAAVRYERALVVPVCVAWMLFSALHLAFHLTHLDGFASADAIGEAASLALVLALPAVVLWLAAGEHARGRAVQRS